MLSLLNDVVGMLIVWLETHDSVHTARQYVQEHSILLLHFICKRKAGDWAVGVKIDGV